jgi:hypothetical protein
VFASATPLDSHHRARLLGAGSAQVIDRLNARRRADGRYAMTVRNTLARGVREAGFRFALTNGFDAACNACAWCSRECLQAASRAGAQIAFRLHVGAWGSLGRGRCALHQKSWRGLGRRSFAQRRKAFRRSRWAFRQVLKSGGGVEIEKCCAEGGPIIGSKDGCALSPSARATRNTH